MVKGLYTAWTGMLDEQNRLDILTNNLANADTTGYKKEGVTTQSFDSVYGIKINDATVGYMNQSIGSMSLGAKIGETYRSWDQGSLRNTDSDYDFALSGQGFFSISFTNKAGETSTLYTRDGSFQMNQEGIWLPRMVIMYWVKAATLYNFLQMYRSLQSIRQEVYMRMDSM